MKRRQFLALSGAVVGVPALSSVLAACGSDGPTATPPGEQRSNVTRTVHDPGLATSAVDSVNGFGTELYRAIAAERPGQNVVVSPASIAIALTMTSAGAGSTTLAEMLATLGIDDAAAIHASMNALSAALDARSHDDVTVAIANSLWGHSDLTFQPAFLEVLAGEYGAAMNTVDYVSDTEGARVAINAWVSDSTEERIPELIDEGVLSSDTRLTLVNAVYLRAPWLTSFDPEATVDGPFTLPDGAVVEVPMMTATGPMMFATGDGWRVVELPYSGGELAMLIFVPEDGFLDQFEEIFLVTDATQYLEPREVTLSLPRFDIESNVALGDVLVAMGMAEAFTDNADFSAMTVDETLYIAAVVHQANITVDEAGTEAAAATAVAMAATSMPAPLEPVTLAVDRPFVFALRDLATGAILFLGRVADPRS